jgi:hexosaminidase
MLDRMTGGIAAEPLRVLADAVEGVGLGPRARAQKYTSLVPMNRLADAARPESESVRALEMAAAKVTANPKSSSPEVAALRRAFTRWSENDARFVELAADNPLLTELKPLSKDLAALGNAGLALLNYLEKGAPLPPAFVADETRELTRFNRPIAEVMLAASRPVKLLLQAAKP